MLLEPPTAQRERQTQPKRTMLGRGPRGRARATQAAQNFAAGWLCFELYKER